MTACLSTPLPYSAEKPPGSCSMWHLRAESLSPFPPRIAPSIFTPTVDSLLRFVFFSIQNTSLTSYDPGGSSGLLTPPSTHFWPNPPPPAQPDPCNIPVQVWPSIPLPPLSLSQFHFHNFTFTFTISLSLAPLSLSHFSCQPVQV